MLVLGGKKVPFVKSKGQKWVLDMFVEVMNGLYMVGTCWQLVLKTDVA